MHGKSIKLVLAVAIVAAGLVSYATPGASAPDRRGQAAEYPLLVIVTKTQPQRPKAGKPFTALVGVVNQETEDVVQSADVACPASIGRRGVRMIEKTFVDSTGIAGCTWMIPAKAGGKHLVAKVEIYSDEGTVRSRFLRVIRP